MSSQMSFGDYYCPLNMIISSQLLEKEEYIERGKAAVRISFSMMYCPENPEVKAQWEKAWPFLDEKDYGFTFGFVYDSPLVHGLCGRCD